MNRIARPRGFTAVELLVVLALVGVLASLAAPSFFEQLARRRLEGVATELTSDLQYARTQSVSNRVDVRLRTTNSGKAYVVENAASAAFKTVNLPSGVTATDSITVTFNPLRGMIAETTTQQFSLSSASLAATLRVDVNVMGRVSLCSPGGNFKGYTACL
jgi:type IV fimbrial biogenesis protein FimT